MKVTVITSTGAKILIWRQNELFNARRADVSRPPEVCLGVDLFEVIAELGGLNLDRDSEAQEAVLLSETAQRRLALAAPRELETEHADAEAVEHQT